MVTLTNCKTTNKPETQAMLTVSLYTSYYDVINFILNSPFNFSNCRKKRLTCVHNFFTYILFLTFGSQPSLVLVAVTIAGAIALQHPIAVAAVDPIGEER